MGMLWGGTYSGLEVVVLREFHPVSQGAAETAAFDGLGSGKFATHSGSLAWGGEMSRKEEWLTISLLGRLDEEETGKIADT